MGEEERRLACEYLKFFYTFFKLESGGAACLEEKVQLLEDRLDELAAKDTAFIRFLEVYSKNFEERRKAILKVKESLNILRAICDGSLTVNAKQVFYEYAKNHLEEAYKICIELNKLLSELDEPEKRNMLEKLGKYIKENNAELKNKLLEARLFIENALTELEKLKPDYNTRLAGYTNKSLGEAQPTAEHT